MAAYRGAQYTGVEAANISDESSTSPNAARPSSTDFRCDVDLVLEEKVTSTRMAKFRKAYVDFDSDISVEHEVVAEKIMGLKRHRVEQKIGSAFVERGIYPVKQYFATERREHGKI